MARTEEVRASGAFGGADGEREGRLGVCAFVCEALLGFWMGCLGRGGG